MYVGEVYHVVFVDAFHPYWMWEVYALLGYIDMFHPECVLKECCMWGDTEIFHPFSPLEG